MNYGGPTKDGGHHHRSEFKRTNRPFKGKSKGKQEKFNKGKVDNASRSVQLASRGFVKNAVTDPVGKMARHNRAKQLQRSKREELMERKRIGSRAGPPRVVAVVPLGSRANFSSLLSSLRRHAEPRSAAFTGAKELSMESEAASSPAADLSSPLSQLTYPNQYHFKFPFGQTTRSFILIDTPRTTEAILDAGKVADIVLFLVHYDEKDAEKLDIDSAGQHAITILKAQGLPSVLGCYQGSDGLNVKKLRDFKDSTTRFFETAFGKDYELAGEDEREKLFRWMSEVRLKSIHWRDSRAFMMASAVEYDNDKQELSVIGYLRGDRPLNANELVHITGFGDFQIDSIEGVKETWEIMAERNNEAAANGAMEDSTLAQSNQQALSRRQSRIPRGSDARVELLHRSDPELRDSLDGLGEIDPLNHEQSIIDEDEYNQDEGDENDNGDEYGDGDGAEAAMGDSADEVEDEKAPAQRPTIPNRLLPLNQQKSAQDKWTEALGLEQEPEFDEKVDDDEDDGDMEDEDEMGDEDEAEKAALEKKKLERDELEYPDEVDFPRDTICHQRFAKYRGLKSFQHSPWDTKENLPLEYSQIFNFSNFQATAHRVVKPKYEETKEGSGEFQLQGVPTQRSHPVRVRLTGVSADQASRIANSQSPIVLFALLEYERKVSVLHFHVQRHDEDLDPVKGKELMEFHVGFRRFQARPIYSQNTKASKNLVERFFQRGRFTVASVYGRIQFPPAPVLMFRVKENSNAQLPVNNPNPAPFSNSLSLVPNVAPDAAPLVPILASGTLMSIDPERLLIKRIILTGSVINSHKRFAVVRHMFFNPADVNYFKPVELWTKGGLVGHIRESRGLKGYMKCLFNGHIKQNDTVCMSLYKRQYPKWEPERFSSSV